MIQILDHLILTKSLKLLDSNLAFVSKMLLDALRWNMLNVIRVELFFNCYKIWNIFITSSIQSPQGQHAIVSLLISLLAQFSVQFDLGWLMNVYGIYLSIGTFVWLHRRVYFYHRRLDSLGVDRTILQFDTDKAKSSLSNVTNGTLPRSDKNAPTTTTTNGGSLPEGHTNSLQRQRDLAYRDFRSVLSKPARTPKEFALSTNHLSHVAGLVGDKDVFDEMHFQILATRCDVVNLLLRAILLTAITILAYLR